MEPSDNELRLLSQAAEPNNDSTELFAAIGVMVGFLLALNAMLLTVPERRRFVADLRMQGYDWQQIVVLLTFQAVVLGLIASAVGVGLGELLSHAFLHRVPVYLTVAFPVGNEEILKASTVAVAIGLGVLATILASLSPVLDLRPSRPTDAALRDREGGSEVIPSRTTAWVSIAGGLSVIVTVALVLAVPNLTIFGVVVLALSTLCAIPGLFAALAVVLRWTAERIHSSALILVVSELRATTTRSVALAGIAALAVYGSVAIGGARDDLVRGLDSNFAEYLQTADVWVTTGRNDLSTTDAFFASQSQLNALAQLPGVASVHVYQGGFLDVGGRRMWIIARRLLGSPAAAREPAGRRQRGRGCGAIAAVAGPPCRTASPANTPPLGDAPLHPPHPGWGQRARRGRDHHQPRLGARRGDHEHGRLPPLLADGRPLSARGETEARGRGRGRAAIGRARSKTSPAWKCRPFANASASTRPTRARACKPSRR